MKPLKNNINGTIIFFFWIEIVGIDIPAGKGGRWKVNK